MTTFTITKAYTSKDGLPYVPEVGEIYMLTAEFDVTGTPKNAYTIGFTMADRYISFPVDNLTPGHFVFTAAFDLRALDGPIPWLVEVDPFNIADAADPTKSPIPHHVPDLYAKGTNQVVLTPGIAHLTLADKRNLKGSFTPRPPAKAIDFYDPRWIVATQSSFATFGAGHIDRLAIMVGAPTTDSWQKLLHSTCRIEWGGGDELLQTQPVEGPTDYPVYLFDRRNVANAKFSMIHQSALEVRAQRVDADKLRAITWSELDALKGINVFKAYMSPEKVIESNHTKITDFVTQTLGKNHRSKFTPYDAARKLFQAVLAKTTYYYPQPGQPDLRPDTAVKMLEIGRGDCGGFSILLVALYRNIGFPARTACGAWVGQDAGHCWCEMFFPHHGWMVSDGSAGNGACEDGSFAYFFGSIPDLNLRYADMRGNTFTIGDISTSWLQGPDGPLVWGGPTATVDSHTGVVAVDEAAAQALGHADARQIKAAPAVRQAVAVHAVNHCPCAKHGGFRAVSERLASTVAAHATAARSA